MSEAPIISVRNFSVDFMISTGLIRKSPLRALKGIDLDIPRSCFFGLVGESGSGKTTFGRALLRAAPITEGTAHYNDGELEYDLTNIQPDDLREYRKRAQLIFQDPYAALSPRMTVRDIIAEPLKVMKLTSSRAETDEKVREIAKACRLNVEHLRRFPHAFSGGQRQRISIARALVSNPRFVVADEAVAALDVSIQADILNLMKRIQNETQATFLFISHDLSVIAQVCDFVAVMYLGQIVETAPADKLFFEPAHPYTQALLAAIPDLDTDAKRIAPKLQGEIPSPTNRPSGCAFHTRCPYTIDICRSEEPKMESKSDGHKLVCHRWKDLPIAAESVTEGTPTHD